MGQTETLFNLQTRYIAANGNEHKRMIYAFLLRAWYQFEFFA
jgi:hypothetical protein